MLEPQISLIQLSKDGRIITLRDSTGVYNSTTNTGGYGFPNLTKVGVAGLIVSVSHYSDKDVYYTHFVRQPDINHPEYFTEPKVADIVDGIKFDITTLHLGITEPNEGIKSFNDGVLDINYYVYEYATPVIGEVGNPYVLSDNGADLGNIFNYDSVVIMGKVYQIDHSKPTNGGQVLWLTEDLEDNTTYLNAAYRANLKVYVDVQLRCAIQSNYSKYTKGCKCKSPVLSKLNQIFHANLAASLDFDAEDYDGANSLLLDANKLTKTLDCKC